MSLLTDLNSDLRDAMQDIRRLVYGLRPPALDELGLVRALDAFVAASSHDNACPPIHVTSTPLPDLPAAVEVAVYRVALEAINNVRRHARAQRCTVELAARDGALELVVTDDGIGIDGQPAGVGIVSMRQRADDLGGRLDIHRATGGGTVVRASLPLSNAMRTAVSA